MRASRVFALLCSHALALMPACSLEEDYVVREAKWSDDDEAVSAVRTVFPNAPNQDGKSLRQEIVRMPADDLLDEEVIATFSVENPVNWVFYMKKRGYISAMSRAEGRRAGFVIDPDDPGAMLTILPPGDDLNLHAFIPSPDGALIAAVSLRDADLRTQVDMFEVASGEFVASFPNLEAASDLVPARIGPRWSPSGDFYLPKTLASSPEWIRFDGGTSEPVPSDPPGCELGPLTSSGVVSATGVGLCFDRHVETCDPVDNQGTPLPVFDCGEW